MAHGPHMHNRVKHCTHPLIVCIAFWPQAYTKCLTFQNEHTVHIKTIANTEYVVRTAGCGCVSATLEQKLVLLPMRVSAGDARSWRCVCPKPLLLQRFNNPGNYRGY